MAMYIKSSESTTRRLDYVVTAHLHWYPNRNILTPLLQYDLFIFLSLDPQLQFQEF